MGLYAGAELIFGIPIDAYNVDDDYTKTPTAFWSEEDEYWREFEGDLEITTYGHYEDPDGPRGILTTKRVKTIRGDCWDPKEVSQSDLAVADKALSKANDEARVNGLDVDFYADAKWWLVANYG